MSVLKIKDNNGNWIDITTIKGADGKDGVDGNDYVITESDYNAIAEVTKNKINIPTKTSQLTNDSGFISNTYHDSTKQDVISDLSTIRSGASLGATALQSIPNTYKTKDENDNLYQAKGNYALTSDIPTKTSDLTNDSNYVTNTDYGTASKAGVIKSANGVNINGTTGTISVATYTSSDYNSLGQYVFIGKGTLENVLTAKGYLTLDTLPKYNSEVE